MDNIERLDNNKEFEISYMISDQFEMKNFHHHEVFEIYMARTDNLKFLVNDVFYYVNTGDLLVFNNHDLHRITMGNNKVYERYVITFKPDFINGLSTEKTDLLACFNKRSRDFSHQIRLDLNEKNMVEELILKLEYHYKGDGKLRDPSECYGEDVYLKTGLAQILIIINRACKRGNTVTEQKSEALSRKIDPVIRYINQNLINGEVSLDHLSCRFYLSKNYLCSIFKKATGFTVNEYITSRRIQVAIEFLKGGATVTETCMESGFNNLSHFIRVFKEYTGISPKQYAKKL